MDVKNRKSPILIIGNGRLSHSVSVCLLQAEHPVTLVTDKKENAFNSINKHFIDLSKINSEEPNRNSFKITDSVDNKIEYGIAIAITIEDLAEKKSVIKQLEKKLSADSVIAINTESIPLSLLQNESANPARILGVNWVEPAHTTYFLELIINTKTNRELADNIFNLAKKHWSKDPYLISTDVGIRAKMFGVMAREAFYLVQNGYASIEDIDRACRNDPGYYLPFSGNFRYMDLMGTYAYGLVMKDLNRELSKECNIPHFFQEIIEQGGLGMENNKGFYKYEKGDVERWNEIFVKFSYQIQDIIDKYPFNHREKEPINNNPPL